MIAAQQVPREPLTSFEVKTGDARVTAMHPLIHVPLNKTLPCLCCCAPCFRKEKSDRELDLEEDKEQEKIEDLK